GSSIRSQAESMAETAGLTSAPASADRKGWRRVPARSVGAMLTPVSSDLVERLRAIAGAAHVLTGPAAGEFTHDATFMEHDLLAAGRPAGTDDVAAVVAACAERGTPVVARGSGTSLVGGPVPLAGGVVLSLDRLTDLEIDVADTVAVAGA